MTATEHKLPSVSTANGTTMEDGDLPFSHVLSWQPLNFRNFFMYNNNNNYACILILF